jgi:hypothetical protein
MHTSEGGVELRNGVSAGDLMVMRGVEPLSEGAPVKISNRLTLEQALIPAKAGSAEAHGGSGSGDGSAAPSGSGSGGRRRRGAQ